MNTVFRTIVVKSEIVEITRALAGNLPSGSGMFVSAFSLSGLAPATHYISEGFIWEMFADAISSKSNLIATMNTFGVQLSDQQAQNLIDNTLVSDQPASVVLSEMGLKPVSEI